MRAVLASGPGRFACRDIGAPQLPPGGRVLAVEAAGVCAADRMIWNGTGPWELAWPFVPGHEILGRDVATGERLTVEVGIPCGTCRRCTGGRYHLCPRARHLGSGLSGGFAQQVALPAQARVHAVPDGLPRAVAVLAEPMACAVHAVRRADVRPGTTVAVIGLGTVGALAVVAARARGASRILAVVRSRAKAGLARCLGAEPVPSDGDGAWTGPLTDRAEAVIECSGDPDAADLALRLAAPGGRVCLYSVYPAPARVDLNQVSEFKELTVTGGHLAPGCFPEAISLLRDVPEAVHAEEMGLADFRQALAAWPRPRVKMALLP